MRYANDRVIGGGPIARYQMIQHLIADMAVEVDAARLMTYRTAWTMDQGERATRVAARSKYFAGEAANKAARAAQQIFAAYALADEYPIKKMIAYIDMLTVGEGPPNVQRILIAEDALGIKDATRHPVRNRARDGRQQQAAE